MDRLRRRVTHLEAQAPTSHGLRLVLHFVGEDQPAVVDSRALVLSLHRPGCTSPDHHDRCEEERHARLA